MLLGTTGRSREETKGRENAGDRQIKSLADSDSLNSVVLESRLRGRSSLERENTSR